MSAMSFYSTYACIVSVLQTYNIADRSYVDNNVFYSYIFKIKVIFLIKVVKWIIMNEKFVILYVSKMETTHASYGSVM